MSASLDQSRSQLLRAAAELADRSGGESTERFLLRYYRHVATEDLLARAPEDLLGAALSHQQLAAHRPAGTANVRVFTPTVEEDGWSCGHSVIEIVTDDMPFLVDSVTAELSREERALHLVVHPQLVVRRDATGDLQEILDVDPSGNGEFGHHNESWMHVEFDRESSEGAREEIAAGLRKVLSDVRDTVEDWPKMAAQCDQVTAELANEPPPGVGAEEVANARGLLEWLAADHFTFLGYREYTLLREDGDDVLRAVPGTGLGLLRYDQPQSGSFGRLTAEARAKARDNQLLIITKANSRATVHRST
jgi:glutamate dehydrogenase